jgi:phosphoribulokinase
MQRPLIVAVCGDSGSGKMTLTDGMVQVFGQERVTHVCLDDYHTLDRVMRLHIGITALHPDANNFALMTDQLRCLARRETIIKPVYDHTTGTFAPPTEAHPADIIIVHGLHALFTAELRSLAHVRIYLDPEAALLHQWKIMRDSTMRGYSVEQVRQQMALLRRDSHRYIQPQKHYADIIIRFSRGRGYYRTRDRAHLDVRLIAAKDTPGIDLSEVLEGSQGARSPSLRLMEQEYAGKRCNVLEIDGTVSHQHARALEDFIWARMENARHLRPDRLGLFSVGKMLRQSETLALTQLILLHHMVCRMHELSSGGA